MIAVILAAGQSTRFGRCKQLEVIQHKIMVQHVIDALPASLDRYLVLGANAQAIKKAVNSEVKPVYFLENPSYRNGLGSSVQIAVSFALEQQQDLLLTLGDLPFVTRADYQTLLRRFRNRPIFAEFGGHVGPPCVIPLHILTSLTEPRGDQGLKSQIREFDQVTIAKAGGDIDTIADLEQWLPQTTCSKF